MTRINMENTPDMQEHDFNIDNYKPVLATVYAEAANQPPEAKRHILSSIINRAQSGKSEFGAENGSIVEVLKRGYSSARDNSPKYQEAMSEQFKDKASEKSYKEVMAIWSGMLKGTVKKSDAEFILTDKDVEDVKKKKLMDMSKLERVYREGDFNFYKYKAADKQLPSKKTASMRKIGKRTNGKLK